MRKDGRLGEFNVDGVEKGANVMTKHMGKEMLGNDVKNCGMTTLDGRCPDARKFEVDAASISKNSLLLVLTLASLCRARCPRCCL